MRACSFRSRQSSGAWAGPTATGFAYQWQRADPGADWTAIVGAVGPTYTPTAADLGSTIRVKVTATGLATDPVSADSSPTAPVQK